MLHEGALVLVGGGVFEKNCKIWGASPPMPPTIGNPGIYQSESPTDRSSRLEVLCKRGVPWKFHKNNRKTPMPEPLLIKRLRHRCPPVNSVKSPRAPFYSTPVLSGSCFYTKAKSSLIFSLISSMRNCKTKLWKKMKIRAERKGKWMQATFRRLFLRNILFLLLFKS